MLHLKIYLDFKISDVNNGIILNLNICLDL